MLNSIYEQKMALAAYATEHGGITMLSSHVGTLQMMMSLPTKGHSMIITPPLQGAMIRHHLAKYGNALLNC